MRKLIAVSGLLLATACGVRPTSVISAGEPAVGRQAVPQTTVYLARGNKLVAVRRPAFPGAPQVAVRQLRVPPTANETRLGETDPAVNLYEVRVTFNAGVLTISYQDYTPASRLTIAQLVCTAMAQPGVRSLRLLRNGASIGPTRCSAFSAYMSP
jgi:hypothetical protein